MNHYLGPLLSNAIFKALSVISNKILPLGLMRTVFFLFLDLTEVGEEMKFLGDCLVGAVGVGSCSPAFKVKPWAPEGLTKALSAWLILELGEEEQFGAPELWAFRGRFHSPLVCPHHQGHLHPCRGFHLPPVLGQRRGMGFKWNNLKNNPQ